MNKLIGDFTLTSGEDPAILETTFPRAVNIDDGLEIGVKGLGFGPIKNLLYPSIELCQVKGENVKKWNLVLADRFYESQADILLEVQRVIKDAFKEEHLKESPFPILREKNEEITMKFTQNEKYEYYLNFKEDMFLNRAFKFKPYLPKQKKNLKRSLGPSKRAVGKKKKIDDLDKSIKAVDDKLRNLYRDVALLAKKVDPRYRDIFLSYGYYMDRSDQMIPVPNHLKIIDRANKFSERIESVERYLVNTNATLDNVMQLDTKVSNINLDVKKLLEIKGKVENLQNEVKKLDEIKKLIDSKVDKSILEMRTHKMEMSLKSVEAKISSEVSDAKDDIDEKIAKANEENDYKLSRVQRSVDDGYQSIALAIQKLASKMGYDEEQIIAADTSNFSTKTKRQLSVIEVTVSTRILPNVQMAFVYGDMIERSLINNKETRMLTTVPLRCQRGYNYYEFQNPVYKAIRVLKFDKLYFYILDKNGKLMKFNLYGDGSDDTKEFPTILNLHIRKAI